MDKNNETVNNFLNVKNIVKNRRKKRKKGNNNTIENYTIGTTNFTTNANINIREDDEYIPNLLEQQQLGITMKDLREIIKNKIKNKNKTNNNIPLKENDIIIEIKVGNNNYDEDDIDNAFLNASKEEDEKFKKNYENVINLINKQTDQLINIPYYNIFDDSKFQSFSREYINQEEKKMHN